MLARIGDMIFESVDKEISIYDVIKEYIGICKLNHHKVLKKVLESEVIPDISFKSIGLDFKNNGDVYEIGGPIKASLNNLKGSYRLITSSYPEIGISEPKTLLEAYDERDGASGIEFEVISNLCRYCSSVYSKHIDYEKVIKREVLPLSGLDCLYVEGTFIVYTDGQLSGKHDIKINYHKNIICSLEPVKSV